MIYLAKYSMGSYDDYRQIAVFASKDKETVEKWVDKFNTKLAYWKEYFSQFSSPYSLLIMEDKYYNKESLRAFDTIMETNKAFIQEIKLR
jgi:hypothetical protein